MTRSETQTPTHTRLHLIPGVEMVTDDVSRMIRGIFPRGRKPRSDRASIGALADALTEMGSPIGPLLTHAVHTLSDREWLDVDRDYWVTSPDAVAETVLPDCGRVVVWPIRWISRTQYDRLLAEITPQEFNPRLSDYHNRNRAIRLLIPCEIELLCEPEDVSPGDHFDDRGDVEWVGEELEAGNEWAWCQVQVTVRVGNREGRDHLGTCSYKSEADFHQPGGYFSDMVRTAFGRAMGFDG